MASGSSQNLKRTNGVVTHATARFGFIELHNKKLPISTVYFDLRSFPNANDLNIARDFPKGTQLSFSYVLTDGEHKVKYKAINIIKNRGQRQTSHEESKPGKREDHGKSQNEAKQYGKECEIYLKRYLSTNGACRINQILPRLRGQKDNCPNVLKSSTVRNLVEFVNRETKQLMIKQDYVCVGELENRIFEKLNSVTDGQGFHLSQLMMLIKPTEQPGQYLYGKEPFCNVSIVKFIERNPEKFVLWNNMIWRPYYLKSDDSNATEFQNDLKAVKFLAPFVINTPLRMPSLQGHIAQAPADLRWLSKRDFLQFLDTNAFFFDIGRDGLVRSYQNRFDIIDRCWMPPSKTQKGKKNKHRKKSNDQGSSEVNNNARAFADISESLDFEKLKLSQPCSDEASSSSRFSYQSATPVQPMLAQANAPSTQPKLPTKAQSKFYGHKEKKTFKNVVGEEISSAVEMKLSSMGLTLNNLILIRLNVGRYVTIKIFDGKETTPFTFQKSEKIDMECLNKILRHAHVVKTDAPHHFGIKGTLSSIRVIEQNGKMSGLTILCQMHENSDGLGIQIEERRKFTAVISDTEQLPLKYVYNYLRTKCKQLAEDNDVLVLDVDGQLSGSGDTAHHSLGNVTRITCVDTSELPNRLTDAVQHSHDYVVTTGVDSVDILEKIAKICSKGVKVIAEVPLELKKDLDTIFSS